MIRPATTEDAVAIQKLISQLGYEITLPDLIENIKRYQQQGIVLVAINSRSIGGFISSTLIPLFHEKANMCRITALCVNDVQRGAGIGKELVQAIENWCQENDCYHIEVTSGHHRETGAHLFYQHLGYDVYQGKRFLKKLTGVIPGKKI